LASALFNDRWQASVVTRPQIEDPQPTILVPDRGPSAASFDLIVLIASALVFVAYLASGFSLPPVRSCARSLAGMTKRLWYAATARLLQLAVLARQIRKPAQPAPEVLAPAVVRRFSQAVRRRSRAERAALLRSRRVLPVAPKDEPDLPMAA